MKKLLDRLLATEQKSWPAYIRREFAEVRAALATGATPAHEPMTVRSWMERALLDQSMVEVHRIGQSRRIALLRLIAEADKEYGKGDPSNWLDWETGSWCGAEIVALISRAAAFVTTLEPMPITAEHVFRAAFITAAVIAHG